MLPKKSWKMPKESNHSKEKHQTFDSIKQLNAMMKKKIRLLIIEKEKDMENLEKKLRYNSIVTNRDYPFCIYPESMLEELFKAS